MILEMLWFLLTNEENSWFLSKENPNFGNKNQVILELTQKVSRLGGENENGQFPA